MFSLRLNFAPRAACCRLRLMRHLRRLLLVSVVLGFIGPQNWAQTQAEDSTAAADERAYVNYQRAVNLRESGNAKRAWRALELARDQLPGLSLPLTRALLTELSIQLGDRKLQSDLWETYQQIIDYQAQITGPYSEESLILRSDYGTELIRKGRFERGHSELVVLIKLIEDPPPSVSFDPDPAVVHQILAYIGMAKIRGGDRKNGVKYLERAQNATPELTQMWERWLVAETLVDVGRFGDALSQFSLLDPFMQESYNFAHPSRVKFRKLYARALREVGNPEYAARILGRAPMLNHSRLPGGPIHQVATGDEPGYSPPELLDMSHPEFPEEARMARVEGRAEALVLLSAQGRIVDAVIKSCTPVGYGFDAALLESVYLRKYKPAKLDGAPVAVEFEVEVDWTFK